MNRIAALLLATLLPLLNAGASDLVFSGGLDYAAPTDIQSGTDQHWTGDASPVFGLSLDTPFSNIPLSFETGIFLKSSKSEKSSGGIVATATGNWTDIPFIVHYHFDPYMSLGIGGFWSFLRSGNAVPASESPDSGLILDLRARIHIAEPLSFVADARYLHGLGNLSAVPGNTWNSRS
ncbi:MAG: hypothetical protein EBX52_09640, partial [Proteobacteria bacterium]|nr:hypothetical protein [Pseudomonadota bacterium]